MLALNNIIDLLDRKYKFLMDSKREDFILDLANFIKFLLEDSQIKQFTLKLYYRYEEENKRHDKIRAKERKKIIAFSKKIRKYLELADPDEDAPDLNYKPSRENYRNTFREFDDIVKRKKADKGINLQPDMMLDESEEGNLIRILKRQTDPCFKRYEAEEEREEDVKIINEFNALKEEREYNFKEWLNFCRVAPGESIGYLCRIISNINPEPKNFKTMKERADSYFSVEAQKFALFESWIVDATYGVISKYGEHRPTQIGDKELDKIIENLKYRAKRVYEAVRQEIGTQLIYKQMLNNYKTRSMWYNFKELWDLVTDGKGKFIRNREEILTLELAKYLFDNGISVVYRMKAGKHEIDMVNPEEKKPLGIEVKVYKDSQARKDIISGVAQLHSYIHNLSSTKNVEEGFYVIYRFGGPLYSLPERINIGKFTINTILIDLGKSKESGRKQDKPVVIKEEEIVKKFKVQAKDKR